MKKVNKKGLDVMVNTAAIVILGIMVAVIVLIFWDMETGRFSNYLRETSGKSNVDSVTAACNSFVSINAPYEYCCAQKTVKYAVGDEIKEEQVTCYQLSSMKIGENVEKMRCQNVCG